MKKDVKRAFKYRGDFKRDLEALENNQIFAPNKELLNDPCEMLTNDQSFLQLLNLIERIHKVSSNKVKSEFESFKTLIHKAGIYSLSVAKEPLNILMWSYYANCHKGFCIEYDLGILTQFNNTVNEFWVKYLNKIPVFKPKLCSGKNNEIIKHFTSNKSKDWEYENEYRLLYDNSGFQKYEFKAVKSIYFGYKMDDKEKDIIFKTLQGRGIHYFQLRLHSKKYKLFCEQVDDPFQNILKKLKIYSDENVDWFIESAKNDFGEDLADYLRKAINLVSNYPNFNNILEGIVKIDNGQPMIKIEYQNKVKKGKINLPKAYCFTLEEIDNEYKNIIE